MSLIDHLATIVGDEHVLTDSADRAPYERDWTGRFTGRCLAVVRPRNVEEVARVVAACAQDRVPLVPQGGNTGLAGGAAPFDGSVLLSSTRLAAIGPVDPNSRQITAEAGVTLEQLDSAASQEGLFWPVDHAARASATIGGAVATNAGGSLAWRYGTTRARVAGIEAVMADGQIIRHLSGLTKNNTGYELSGLLVGSEGTLAIVTAARLRLARLPTRRATAILGIGSMEEAVQLFLTLRDRCDSLHAAEFFLDDGLTLVREHAGLPAPLPGTHRVYALVECASDGDPESELAEGLQAAGNPPAAVAQSDDQRRSLWVYRDRLNEATGSQGVPRKMDVAVPIGALARFCSEVVTTVESAAAGVRTVLFGHLGDGNVHVNVLDASDSDTGIEDAVYELTNRHGGTISAEHGIGRGRKKWLHLSRSSEEIAAMRAIKRALDPHSLLNPGALFDPD